MAFEPNCVQAHIVNVGKIRIQPSRRPSQKHVFSPGRAANQHFAAIHLEEPMAPRSKLRSNFANSKIYLCLVRNLLAGFKKDSCVMQCWGAHLIGPPELRMLKIEFWELRWQKFYNPGFSARQ